MILRKKTFFFVCLLSFLLLFQVTAHAYDISGTVRDSGGVPITGVEVRIDIYRIGSCHDNQWITFATSSSKDDV